MTINHKKVETNQNQFSKIYKNKLYFIKGNKDKNKIMKISN